MRTASVTTRILVSALCVITALAVGLMYVMTLSMNSLTDTIMLETLQPMAKTAAQSVEGNLHTMAERFFLIRDNTIIAAPDATPAERLRALDRATAGMEFVWVGLYEPDGALLAGTEDCPRNISGRALFATLRETGTLSIEDTSIGYSGPELAMGLPVVARGNGASGRAASSGTGPAWYLVGGYRYDVLSDILRTINVGANGVAFIINGKGQFIAHRSLGKVFSRESVTGAFGSGPDAGATLLSMRRGQTGSVEIAGPEGSLFVSFAPVRGTLWSLGIQAPRSDFTLAARQALATGALITVVALLIFSVILTVSIRKILSRPLAAITHNARDLAEGEFDTPLPAVVTDRRDEIGQLGRAFWTMSNSIRGVIQDIGRLTATARAGNMGQRADYAEYQGDYRLILAGINASLDVFCSHLDAMPSGIMFLGEGQRPLYRNKAMTGILARHGLYREAPSLLAALLSSRTSDTLEPLAAALFEPGGHDGDTFKADITLKDLHGEECNYDVSLWRVGDGLETSGNGMRRPVCVMLICNDVTQLAKAKTDAESASRAKGDFLSRMSHEMRTPMNAIIGMASIGQSSPDAERKEYCLVKISEASQHLLGVINDILDMSKIEADKFELVYADFSFEKMLQRVTNVLNFRVDEKRQNLFVSIDKDLPHAIIADEQRLAQVVTNLLANAVKFTPEEGTITLRARKTAETEETCAILVEVRDTGIGISEEQQKRLFSSFEQADGSISRKYGGTGLGLAISKRIIELMGGAIWVESEPERGTSFFFQIEVRKGESAPPAHIMRCDWAKLRILAVDDAPEILDLFASILDPHGVHHVTAESGEQALERLEENRNAPFDVIFIDLRMPGMNGMELASEITRRGYGGVLVLMTAAEWSDLEADARAAGISRFLQKPLFPSTLVNCVNECTAAIDEAACAGPESASVDGIFAGSRILIAEDVDINREIIAALIESTAVTIEFANDGEEAVAKFTANPGGYEMVLMDVHMPKVDGYEATRRIRSSGLPGAETLPIVAMTANVFREDVERCLASGMNGHLGKPVDPDEVIATLAQYLAR